MSAALTYPTGEDGVEFQKKPDPTDFFIFVVFVIILLATLL